MKEMFRILLYYLLFIAYGHSVKYTNYLHFTMIHDRDYLMSIEGHLLAPYAVKTTDSRGRKHKEQQEKMRLPFQKDRDRVLHSRAFRRLKMKTQVFVAHYGDHYRTRMTHSLEVAQVSRDIARALGLNEDLSEAIALAHDLGHTPFGHAGEHALDEMMKPFGLEFEHNQQSKRIVEEVEQIYPDFKGLNLTFETRQGLMKHQSPWDQADSEFHGASLEAQVVNLADEIAYNNHDTDDGLRSGLITEEDLKTLEIWHIASKSVEKEYGAIGTPYIRQSRTISAMFGQMIADLIQTSSTNIKAANLQTLEDVYRRTDALVLFSEKQFELNKTLREFLSKRIYFHKEVLALSNRGQQIIRELFNAYHNNSTLLPEDEQQRTAGGEPLALVIKDYISGMTDEFAEQEWERLRS
jgi:dGTPase